MRKGILVLLLLLLQVGCVKKVEKETAAIDADTTMLATLYKGEVHLTNVRQLTFGGQNAEAYFSFDGTELIFQSTRDSMECDAIFRMNADGSNVRQVSSGDGTTTCSFIAPDGKSIIYCSTHEAGSPCPQKPDMSQGYVWSLYESYDIYSADPDGSNPVKLTDEPGYDAEAVYSPLGDKIIFTSVRTGDLELFLMDPDGSNVEQLTDEIGYDGGAFFSVDGQSICWRASRPEGKERQEYTRLLKQGLIHPRKLDLYVMDLKDRTPVRLTDNGAANFGPYFHPDGKRVIFCSNLADSAGRNFDLFMVDIATKEIKQITHNPTFDGFPMFSHDGKKFVFCSNRDNKVRGETNVFIADWID